MVISRTKYNISIEDIRRIFLHAGLGTPSDIRVLGAGEFNSVYAVEAGGQTYALKVAANNDAVQIYERDMMKSELHWYQVISGQTDLRVPNVFFSDFMKQLVPTNYFIMEFLAGKQKDELTLTPEQQTKADTQIARMIAKLHRIKGDKFGYIQSGLYDTWDQALYHIVENLMKDAQKVKQNLPNADKLLDLIVRYQDVLKKAPCRLISFDAWDPNFICVNDDPGHPEFAWIDPERCLWGDPLMDFVTMELGKWKLAEKIATVTAYNELAEFPVSATREDEIRYAFGLCYLATIVDCEKYYRYSPDLPNWQRSVEFSAFLYELGFSMLE